MAGSLRHRELQHDIERLTTDFAGRVGLCVTDHVGVTCMNGDQRFSIQSVMKLVVALAVMDAAEHKRLRLDDKILIRREDLSLSVQPLADLVGKDGYITTIDDLVRRAIVDSDSAAVDTLIGRLGGTKTIQAFLDRKHLAGVRLDRDERHLQTETVGLTWRPAYVDAELLEKETAAVPDAQRTAAYQRYQTDIRDTATPEGMARLLGELSSGKLLSPAHTRRILDIMAETATGADRLKAGLSPGWILRHKTGTSGSWRGLTVATNDVGILQAPDGGNIVVVVFIGDSTAPAAARAALMAKISAAVINSYR